MTSWQIELCRAIKDRVAVELTYEEDRLPRTYLPHAVYNSTKDNICVSGTQTSDPNKYPPPKDPEPRIFDLEKIRLVVLTDAKFAPDPRFDRFDPRYKNGIICSV